MNIVILSRNARGYSIKRLKEAARQRGHRIRVLDTLEFTLQVEGGNPDLLYRNRRLGSVDAVVPRIGASISSFGTAVVRQFEQMGVFSLNSSHAITVSRDKLRSLQVLSRHDVRIPASAFVRRKEDVRPAIEKVGGAPVVIKMLEGSQGVGVILAETVKIAEAIIETLHSARQSVLVQKFIAESKGRDIRAFVVGGQVVAAMRRVASGAEFRSNVHRGGRTEPVELDAEYERVAVMSAQIMGLRMAGVDLLEGEDGPLVMEVNSSPGLEGIEKATEIDIAGAIVEHLNDIVQFPDIDLQQRLSIKNGYGVAEFTVVPRSSLANKTIAESGLRDREVLVININRNGLIIPAPRGDQKLLKGDKLLCFGKQLTLKSMLPPPRRRRKKKETVSVPEN